jgi:hypothetical protein
MTKRDEFVAARPHVNLTTGEVIRMLRDLKGWTQAELAKRSAKGSRLLLTFVVSGLGSDQDI